jgi:hypothetical protein
MYRRILVKLPNMKFNPLKPKEEREKRKWGGVAIGTTFNRRGRT